MADISEDFVWQFRHLEGDLLGDQKKNLFKLLRKKNLFTNQEQLNNTLKKLHPETHIQHLFYVNTLIYFKRTPELVDIVKQGNEVYISKIFKHPWFFEEAFKNIDASVLVNEFLPCLSFAIRMKVLKWLTVHLGEDHMDKIFDCVLERYGMRIASCILHACGSTKIIEVLSKDDYEIKLKPTQVKRLFDKNINTFKFYLKHHKNITGSLYSNENVLKHIALKNPLIILELKEDMKISGYHLGRRTSKKVVGLVKDSIVKNVNDYTDIVNCSIMVRELRGCFPDIYLSLFPKKLKDINRYSISKELLAYYPKNRRWDLFERTFSQVFQDKNVLDILGNLDYELVQFCPRKDVIYNWAEIKYKEDNNTWFLSSFEPEKAFSVIKERINVTSKYNDRQELLRVMVNCCKRNNDMHSLEKALQYICTRHRNEPVQIRESILKSVTDRFNIDKLSESHWRYIKEMLDVMRIQGQLNTDLLVKYIEFSYKNNLPFKDDLKEFVKTKSGFHCLTRCFLLNLIENRGVEKELLINIGNILPDVVTKGHEYYETLYEQFVWDIVEFSVKNKEYFIILSKFKNVLEYITDVLNDMKNIKRIVSSVVRYNSNFPDHCIIENSKLLQIIVADSMRTDTFEFEDVVRNMVTKKNRSDFENKMLQCYFEKILEKHISHNINFWFMKNEPSAIFPFIDKIFTKCLIPDVLNAISGEHHLKGIKYTRFNFEARLIALLKEQLNNVKYNRKQLIEFLFYLASTEELISIIDKYFLPKKQKLDLQDDEMKEIYETQCHVAKSLKKVMDPSKMLSVVFNFAVGDYLRSALPSLYSIFYRSPENIVYEKIGILSGKSVSVRKHAIFLSCELLNFTYTTNILKITNQKNVSSEKHRFSSTLKYFVKNPSPELFEVLVSNMHVVDKNDKETLEKLAYAGVPKTYQALYIEKCWEFFESIKEKDVKVSTYLNSLLRVVTNASSTITSLLTSNFCRHVITFYLNANEDVPFNTELFTCYVLRYRQSEQIANFNLVFEIMANHKRENENNRVNSFFKNLHKVASTDLDSNFLNMCDKYWNNLYTPIEKFNEFVSLKLLVLKSKSPEPFVESYAKNVVDFLEQLVAEYDLFIFQKFRNALNQDLYSFEVEKKCLFIYNVIKYKSTKLNSILIMDVMDKAHERDSAMTIKTFNDTLEILKSIDDPVVKIYYNSKFST